MTKLLTKIKGWFQPKPDQKKRLVHPKKLADHYQPINHRHYRKLIGKVAKQAIAIQRARQRRNHD